MKHKLKIIVCISLTMFITFSSVAINYLNTTQIVYADTRVSSLLSDVLQRATRYIGYIFTNPAEVVPSIIDFFVDAWNSDDGTLYKGDDNKWYVNVDKKDDGSYKLSEKFMKTTEKVMDEYISINPDFVMIPTTKNTSLMPSYFKFSTLYETVSKHITDLSASYVFVSADGKGGIKPSATPFVIDLSNSILIGKSSMYGHELLSGACYGFHKDANGIPRYFGHLYVLDKKTVSVRDFIQYDYSSPDNGTTIECSEKRSGRYGDKYIGELNIDISTETSSYFKYAPSRYYFIQKTGNLYIYLKTQKQQLIMFMGNPIFIVVHLNGRVPVNVS